MARLPVDGRRERAADATGHAAALPSAHMPELGTYDKVFRVDVVFAKWKWHSIEHSYCHGAPEAAAEIVRLANKYMDDGLLSLARQISQRRLRESADIPPFYSADAPPEGR